MTSFTPTRTLQKGENDLGGTHRLNLGFGWSELASSSAKSLPIFHDEARLMGEPAWGIDEQVSNEVGGPQDLDEMPIAVIQRNFDKKAAPDSFGGTTRVLLPILSTNSAT